MSKLVEEIILKVKMDADNAEKTLNKTNSQVNTLDKSMVKLTGAIAGVIATMKGLDRASDTAIKFEKIADTMTLAFGSAKKASEEFSFLENISEQLGIRIDTTAESYAKLAVATKGTSLEGAETRKLLVSLTSASTALGMSAEDTQGVLKAFEQMLSKGKIQAEELRGQLGDRLVGAFRMTAQAVGVSTQELDKMLENGELLAEKIIPKLSRQLQSEFGESALNKSGGSMANLNRLANEVNEAFRVIGVVANSAFGPMSVVVGKSVDVMKGLIMSTLEYGKDILPELLTVVQGIWSGISNIFSNAITVVGLFLEFVSSGWAMLFDQILGDNWMEEITVSLTVMAKNFPEILASMYTKIGAMTAHAISGLINAWKDAQYEISATALAVQSMLPSNLGGLSDEEFEDSIDMLNKERNAESKIPNWADELASSLDSYNKDLQDILGDSYNQEKDNLDKNKDNIKGEVDRIKGLISNIFANAKDSNRTANDVKSSGAIGADKKITDNKNAFEVGSELANEFLNTNKIAVDQLEWTKKIAKNTENNSKNTTTIKTKSI
jgi:tape measure domain-containing protein